MDNDNSDSLYQRIYKLVKQIPKGQVATYGQIAKMVGRCGPRQVGYAMSHTPKGQNIPWQRVVNSHGRISVRKDGAEDPEQMKLLKKEGILFSRTGKLDFAEFAWFGPDWEWMQYNDYQQALPPGIEN